MTYIYTYILKSLICSLLFVAYYYLALRNKTFHKYNRFYILGAVALSLVLPLFKLEMLFERPEQLQYFTYHYYHQFISSNTPETSISSNTQFFTKNNIILFFIATVILASLTYILKTMYFIYVLKKKNEHIKIENVSMVLTNHNSTPFSFWKTIFWNKNISLDNEEGKMILQHELAHIKDKHTIDKLFINIITAFFWFNPFFWIFKKELFLIHEFIADEKSGAQHYKAIWASALLTATYPKNYSPIFNSFFYSPLKRRLLMLSKTNNPAKNYVLRLAAFVLILLTSLIVCVQAQKKINAPTTSAKIEVLKSSSQSRLNSVSISDSLGKDWIDIKSDEIVITGENSFAHIGHVSIKISSFNQTLYFNGAVATLQEINALDNNSIQMVTMDYVENKPEKTILKVYTYQYVKQNNIDVPKTTGKTKIMKLSQGDGEQIYSRATARVQAVPNINNLKTVEKRSDIHVDEKIKISADEIIVEIIDGKEKFSANGNVKIEDKITGRPIQQFPKDAAYIEIKKVNVSGKNKLKEVDIEIGNKISIKNKLDFKSVLVIIDGIEQPLNNMENISPNDIKSIDVLKAKAATDIYGEKGKNGVLIITTKKPKQNIAL